MFIGNVEIKNNVVLAPMAGVTDLPFRLLCKEMGCGLLYTEMVSAKAIMYNNKNTEALLKVTPQENPIAVQLFGSEPAVMSEIAKRIEERPFDIIDVNMGCPVPKVVNNGEGSALLKNPKLVGEIVEAMAKAVKKPVTVKIRAGFDETSINAPQIAHVGSALLKNPKLVGEIVEAMAKAVKKPVTVKIRAGFDETSINAPQIAHVIQESGGAAVAVHARTRQQYYSGHADWDVISRVKEAVSIPVIGNGDILCGEDAVKMFEQTKCDAVMIGRGAQGNPWIFKQINDYMTNGTEFTKPSANEVCDMIMRHAVMLIEAKGEYTGIREMRKHFAWYTAGMKHAAVLRNEVNHVEHIEQLEELVNKMRD